LGSGVVVDKDECKQVVERLFVAFDALDERAMSELLTPDFVAHGLPDGFSGDVDGWKRLAAHWASGFSGDSFAFEDVIAENDRVAVRFSSRGRHTGDFLGVPPSNRTVTITGIEIYRLVGGRVAEYWGHLDTTDLTGSSG
jgi:predicted ester cyclase